MGNCNNKYNKQINFTSDLRRMYEICSNRDDLELECDTILGIYAACDLDIMDVILASGDPYDYSLSAMLAMLDNIGLYLYYLPDILLVSNVLVELANRDHTLENLTQGQKNWINKKF